MMVFPSYSYVILGDFVPNKGNAQVAVRRWTQRTKSVLHNTNKNKKPQQDTPKAMNDGEMFIIYVYSVAAPSMNAREGFDVRLVTFVEQTTKSDVAVCGDTRNMLCVHGFGDYQQTTALH
eukprot:scaffold7415_cov170-Amphora_coffeaeformis.AAC.14